MTPKEIFLELLKKEGRPERLLDQYEAVDVSRLPWASVLA